MPAQARWMPAEITGAGSKHLDPMLERAGFEIRSAEHGVLGI